jgi:hypothetical protein
MTAKLSEGAAGAGQGQGQGQGQEGQGSRERTLIAAPGAWALNEIPWDWGDVDLLLLSEVV